MPICKVCQKEFEIYGSDKLCDDCFGTLSDAILNRFDESKDVKDTIWYDDSTTLYDEILFVIKDWINQKLP